MLKKLLLVSVMAATIGAFFALDLGSYLTLDSLKSQQAAFEAYYQENTALTLGAYFAAYVIATALSLPGATILTLAGGALFGLWVGIGMVSISSTVGATLAFLASRYIFGASVQSKYKDKLRTINQGIKEEGAFYLFSMRLMPIFPFFLINGLMGLTPMKVTTYFFASMLGMLPGTAVYVNAGTALAGINSLSDILSPSLIASFLALGIFPLVVKWLLKSFKAPRQQRRGPSYLQNVSKVQTHKPSKFDYNLVVIGAGSGGLVSAYIAAAIKAKVALIEKNKMGGDCLNTGCVPSKALIRSAKMLNYAKRAKDYGFRSAVVDFEFAEVMERVQRVIKKVEPHDSVERYTGLGVECIQGEAKITNPYVVRVGNRSLTTKNIIIATGASPFIPPIPGLDQVDYYTSDTIWELRKQPRTLVVLGGGPIGTELAQAFNRLSCRVIQVEMGPRILSKEDSDISDLVQRQMEKEGVIVLPNHKAIKFERRGDKQYLHCETVTDMLPGQNKTIEFDAVLLALGRRPRTTGFGAEDLGIELTKRGSIQTDPFMRTNFKNIYAVGDVTTRFQFTHVAAHEAWYASVNALLSPFKKFEADYNVIPWCTYTEPEVARVGLNEREARALDVDYDVTTYGIDDLDRAIADEDDHGMVKVLTVPGKDIILGVTIAGSHAGDIIPEFVLAMKYGLGLNEILGTIHIYPTLGEANKYVAGAWKKANAPTRLLKHVKNFHKWRRG